MRPGVLITLIAAFGASAAARPATDPHDYPTSVRADYVLGCMAANGQTREMLEKCSCSIDYIASALPYERYEEAETTLRMRQAIGERIGIFRDDPGLEETLNALRRAQTESQLRCF